MKIMAKTQQNDKQQLWNSENTPEIMQPTADGRTNAGMETIKRPRLHNAWQTSSKRIQTAGSEVGWMAPALQTKPSPCARGIDCERKHFFQVTICQDESAQAESIVSQSCTWEWSTWDVLHTSLSILQFHVLDALFPHCITVTGAVHILICALYVQRKTFNGIWHNVPSN